MTASELLTILTMAGCQLTADGTALRVYDPQHVLTEALRQTIRQHKAALLTLLQEVPPAHTSERVGRQGEACPQCGDTWQWPTTSGRWICPWCFVTQSAHQAVTGPAIRTVSGSEGHTFPSGRREPQ